MTLKGLHSEQYILGRELGRGGEGTVYELQNDSSRVLKRYNELLTATQVNKLKLMVSMRSPGIEAYAAWPEALVVDDKDNICGFVMKKLTGFVPLHMIFSPLDRKNKFPDKGYNFLVHVARNLATAFHKLHDAGLVVGDVNEGNILISSAGLVSFIDCDSFQVKGTDSIYFCEVGVPRYTPPELLSAQTFENVVRTINTDSFSLAILIFQLLFLGRHPFAGKNKSAQDIDEETAIRLHEFAYSLSAKKKKLSPPNDSFNISNLNDDLISYFHKAFETDDRPLPGSWVKALDAFILELVICSESNLHSYPAKLKECPWCYFKRTRGIMFFLDDTVLKANAVLNDIEHFVNGFKVDKLELNKWSGSVQDNDHVTQKVDRGWYKQLYTQVGIAVVCCLAFIGVSIISHNYILCLGGISSVLWIKYGTLAKKIKAERDSLRNTYAHYATLLEKMIQEYNMPPGLDMYNKALGKLNQLVNNFRQLPDEGEKMKKLMEERIYNDYLAGYLRQFDIQSHEIASFGPAKKTILLSAGIRNASDISLLHSRKIPGIGPKNMQVLISWQRQMSSGFVYIPDTGKLSTGLLQVVSDLEALKLKLEHSIRIEYQSVTYMKQNITNRSLVLERQINDLIAHTTQAKSSMLAFDKFSRFI